MNSLTSGSSRAGHTNCFQYSSSEVMTDKTIPGVSLWSRVGDNPSGRFRMKTFTNTAFKRLARSWRTISVVQKLLSLLFLVTSV